MLRKKEKKKITAKFQHFISHLIKQSWLVRILEFGLKKTFQGSNISVCLSGNEILHCIVAINYYCFVQQVCFSPTYTKLFNSCLLQYKKLSFSFPSRLPDSIKVCLLENKELTNQPNHNINTSGNHHLQKHKQQNNPFQLRSIARRASNQKQALQNQATYTVGMESIETQFYHEFFQ